MRRIAAIATIALAALSPLLAKAASAQEKPVYRIALADDIINPVSAEYIQTAIRQAESQGAEALVIELDTPGGLLSSTRAIVRDIMNAKVPIVVYVAPRGARAGSAGVFITLAANVAAMAPSTNIGAAHPVELQERRSSSDSFEELLGRLLRKEEGKEKKEKKEKKPPEPPMAQKILNDTKAWAEAIARDRGRNVAWAIKAVEESVSVPDDEARRLGIIDLIAANTDDLVAKLDGRSVAMPSGEVVLKTAGAAVVDLPKTFRLRWLSALAHPNIAYILLMLGFYGLLFEFTHPGVGFPGIAGAVCLILAFFGLQVLPTNYAGIALIVLAIGMFIAEVKVTSYGLLTIGGVVSLFLGSLILFPSPYDFMRVSLPLILAFTLSTVAIATFLTYIVVRARRKHIATGAEGLVGETGEVKRWEGRRGKVFVHGELWDATSDEEQEVGASVKITSVSGMTLVVQKPSFSAQVGVTINVSRS